MPLFLAALVLCACGLALCVDLRFPRLAPASLTARAAAAAAAIAALALLPVSATVASLVAVLLPALGLSFLTTLWLVRVAVAPAASR